jgi:hypothetical protein
MPSADRKFRIAKPLSPFEKADQLEKLIRKLRWIGSDETREAAPRCCSDCFAPLPERKLFAAGVRCRGCGAFYPTHLELFLAHGVEPIFRGTRFRR